MTKSELAEKVVNRTGLAKTKALATIDAVFEGLSEALANGEFPALSGFGKFAIVEQAERKGHNPFTGNEITIPARRCVRFKISKSLKDRLNP